MPNHPGDWMLTALAVAAALAALAVLRFGRGRTYGAVFGRGAFHGVSADTALHVAGQTRPTRWIDAAERLQIEAAIGKGLGASDAELVVAVAARCRSYPEAGWRLGLLLAAALPLALAAAGRPTTPLALVALQATALAWAHLLCGLPALQRVLLSGRRTREAVRARAFQAWVESGLPRSPGGGGMLVFVALFERRLALLMGEGLAASLETGESAAELAGSLAAAFARSPRDGAGAAAALAARLRERDRGEAPAERPLPVVLIDEV